MREELKGKVIRVLNEKSSVDLGRIVYDCIDSDDIFYVPFPRQKSESAKQRGRRLLAPKRLSRYQISLLGNGKEVLLVDYVPLSCKTAVENQAIEGVALDKNRRNIRKWMDFRDEKIALIKPIVSQYQEYELLELGLLNEVVDLHAKKLGMKTSRKIEQAMRHYFLGCGDPNAMLPAWGNSGGKGTHKLCSVKTGRPARRQSMPNPEREYVLTQESRQWLSDGWGLFKKPRVSVHTAYLLTCVRYFPGPEIETDKDGNRYSIAPRSLRPTKAQFRNASKGQAPASRINMGERVHRMTQRALTGHAADGIYAVGQVGLIDSTSEDQTPVSAINPLKILPSTYRTICVDVLSEYILGMYCGFEHPSTLTSLLAILNCAEDKVEFCRKHGVEIGPGEWYSRVLKRVRGDNGELKSELAMQTMSSMEVSAEFVRSYGGDMKGPVEAIHKIIHRQADHHASGSTQGRRKERGDQARESEATRCMEQNMPHVIRAVLRHNNEDLVPQLLTVEMRADGVVPTRRAIYEWYVSKGYVASEPTNIDTLRALCLPKLKAVIHRDGLHIFDPRDPRRLVPNLVFTSKWLAESGLCNRAVKKSIKCEVMLNPQSMECCYVYRNDKLHELHRKTSDPLIARLSLCELLAMTDDDWMLVDQMTPALEASDAKAYATNQALNHAAKKAKKIAQAAAVPAVGVVGKDRHKGHEKRKNREEEMARQHLKKLGVEELPPPRVALNSNIVQLERPPRSSTSGLMDQVRTRRSKLQ